MLAIGDVTHHRGQKTIFTAIVVTSITKGRCIYNNNIDEVIITGALSDGNNMTSHAYHQPGGYIFTFFLLKKKITKREEDSRSTLDNERVHLDAFKKINKKLFSFSSDSV